MAQPMIQNYRSVKKYLLTLGLTIKLPIGNKAANMDPKQLQSGVTISTMKELGGPDFACCYARVRAISMQPMVDYMGGFEVVADFLPSPAELAFREDGVKLTLAQSKNSVDFFKSEASKHQTQYQRVIRRLLDAYVQAQSAVAGQVKRRVSKSAPRN